MDVRIGVPTRARAVSILKLGGISTYKDEVLLEVEQRHLDLCRLMSSLYGIRRGLWSTATQRDSGSTLLIYRWLRGENKRTGERKDVITHLETLARPNGLE